MMKYKSCSLFHAHNRNDTLFCQIDMAASRPFSFFVKFNSWHPVQTSFQADLKQDNSCYIQTVVPIQ